MGYPPSRSYFELAGARFGSPGQLMVLLRHVTRRQQVEPCVGLVTCYDSVRERRFRRVACTCASPPRLGHAGETG